MKDQKNDSTQVLARFGRDKRVRVVKATAERVERRPRLQRDAADSEQPYQKETVRRASYNPHFTEDNRPKFDNSHSPRPAYGRYGDDERPRRDGEHGHRTAERSFRRDERPQHGDERPRTFDRDSRNSGGERPRRAFGDRPAGERAASGGRTSGPKRFDARGGEHQGDGKPFGSRNGGDRRFGDRKAGQHASKPAFRKENSRPASYPKYDPAKQTGEMRLNRFLAQSGICSRREADDFITAGLVSVNGQIVTELGTKVLPTDEVKFNDSRVQGEKKVYLVLNKPKGYVTSLDDPHAGKTVMELVKGACTERIYPVGRLDKNSLGLLLFTNDGDLTKQLTHPSYRKKKIYQVTLDKPLTRADMDRIAEGITLEDGEIFADEISYVKENKQEVGIEIHSGRNRIVRRIFEFLGYTVTKLDRVYYAGLTKKNLKRGAWRFLSREEVERLKSGQYE